MRRQTVDHGEVGRTAVHPPDDHVVACHHHHDRGGGVVAVDHRRPPCREPSPCGTSPDRESDRRAGAAAEMCEHVFVSGQATILHADLDAFYASVEQRDRPQLRGRPVLVGHGVVLAASYEAKACGVRTAMGGGQARRLCPHAVVVEPRMAAYAEASRAVFDVFEDTTPLVEGLSIDEAFLDVGGLRRVAGTPVQIAARLRRRVAQRWGLPITVGVARTKFLAKVASGVAKPDGLLVVPPDAELAFLHPLPVERLWGCRPGDRGQAARPGASPPSARSPPLARGGSWSPGRAAPARARPQPRSPGGRGGAPPPLDRVAARPGAGPAHAGRHRPGGRGAGRPGQRRMRAARRVGRTVMLRLRFGDFARATRSHTLPLATAHTPTILSTARGLVRSVAPTIEARGLTLVGISVGSLDDDQASGSHCRSKAERSRPSGLDVAIGAVAQRTARPSRRRFTSAGKTRPTVPLRRTVALPHDDDAEEPFQHDG